jgi:hypothetical protein
MPAQHRFAALLAMSVSSAAALARPEITPASFSGSETRITFDSFVGGGSVSFGEVVDTQFAPLGIVFSNPDFQNRANAWPSNQHPGHSLPNALFVDQDGGITPSAAPLEIIFSVPVNRVGMYFCGSQDNTYTLKVYNEQGLVSESLTRPGITTPSGTHIYLGIERPDRISKAVVSARRPQSPFPIANFFIDDVQFEPWPRPCYPNCDGSTGAPVLTGNDFACFLGAFAAGQAYANCDGTTMPPAYNVNDFVCFLTRYAAGCS